MPVPATKASASGMWSLKYGSLYIWSGLSGWDHYVALLVYFELSMETWHLLRIKKQTKKHQEQLKLYNLYTKKN